MKGRWIAIGLCCSLLLMCGCTEKKKSDDNSATDNQQEDSGDTRVVKDTELEPGIGEGTSSMELQDLTESEEYKVGDKISISSDGKKYELQIDSVSYTEGTNTHTEDLGNIVLIDYTYHNLSDEPLLVGDIRFQLTDSGQETVYEPYYFDEQVVAEPVENGESTSAQVAFAQVDEGKELLLVYTDISSEEKVPILVRIDEVKNK